MDARSAPDEDTALERAALDVLDANWTGTATVPSVGRYPHQWSWDSAFVAIGLSRRRWSRACEELLSLFAGQWSTGMVPHIVFDPAARDSYYPGPSIWRSGECAAAPRGVPTSGLTQPPLHACAVWWIWRYARDRDAALAFVRRTWPCLVAQHRYLASARDLGGEGLAAIVHPWESGLDDSPAWDAPLAALPMVGYACGLEDWRSDSHHDRWVWLALRYRDAGYGPGYLRDEHPFAVEDPMFNGIWLASCLALADLAGVIGADGRPFEEAAERIRGGLLARLWEGAFYARDLRAGSLIPIRTIGGFGPLLDPGMPATVVGPLVELLESCFLGPSGYPVPSCEVRALQFDRERYWRGPSWVNTNWLLRQAAAGHGLGALERLLATATLRLVRQAGFRECFDPFDGMGRGCRDFSWSAALTLDLLAG
ncbi:MGH1-like glycoside hydrolase domain-containing protein [Sphaerisporangium rhizosphaerae]|uniref:Mannosylglycerate hydrolase MGH1-like glycoside hydrolase domain-containing protein n=1 Tax=Sphaerisporangium rhizosphaerae TaxID=2269375 RepID=A0ABW2NVN1_9ACTN